VLRSERKEITFTMSLEKNLCFQYMFIFMFAVHVGGPRDTPEMRERIRRVRRVCLGKLYSNYIFKHLKNNIKIEFASVKRIVFLFRN